MATTMKKAQAAASVDLESSSTGDIPAQYENFPPGTVLLDDPRQSTGHGRDGHVLLQPTPSRDPNDPLNWTTGRKWFNYSIICFYALMIFAILDIGPVVWQLYNEQLGITYTELNNTFATNCAGLAVGCVIFIPFALKFGRRPVYIISTFITFGMAIWQAALHTYGEMLATQVISGLSGAVSETLVQMTVADVFFVHQRGTMNGVYLMMVSIGTFLAPVASGYIANAQGWRWLYWWCTIFIGISTVLFVFFYEETKYIPSEAEARGNVHQLVAGEDDKTGPARNQSIMSIDDERIDYSIPLRTYRQRLAFTTTTKGSFNLIFRHTYQPFWILFTFPAAAYTALQYGSILAWFSVLATTEATYFYLPPYNFGPIGIGLLNLPAFLGCIFGAIWGGPLSDWSILFFAKRNKGIYEPEMRLWLAMFPVFIGPAGLWLYGYSLAAGMHWIIPCVGIAFFGFALTALGDTSLTYLSDCYREMLGDALVAVAFVRNLFATIIVFALAPWTMFQMAAALRSGGLVGTNLAGLGLHDTFTSVGCLALVLNLSTVPMIIWGKKFRIMCAKRYAKMAERQFDSRAI